MTNFANRITRLETAIGSDLHCPHEKDFRIYYENDPFHDGARRYASELPEQQSVTCEKCGLLRKRYEINVVYADAQSAEVA
jgi:hypothetical protein